MAYIDVYNAWRSSSALRNRAIVAVASYAHYLHGAGTAPQRVWADAVIPGTNAEIEVDAVAWAIAFDPVVVANGDAISDSALQSVVETALNTYRIPAA